MSPGLITILPTFFINSFTISGDGENHAAEHGSEIGCLDRLADHIGYRRYHRFDKCPAAVGNIQLQYFGLRRGKAAQLAQLTDRFRLPYKNQDVVVTTEDLLRPYRWNNMALGLNFRQEAVLQVSQACIGDGHTGEHATRLNSHGYRILAGVDNGFREALSLRQQSMSNQDKITDTHQHQGDSHGCRTEQTELLGLWGTLQHTHNDDVGAGADQGAGSTQNGCIAQRNQ